MMSYNNNWAKELKESYIEEKKATEIVKKGAKVVKEVGKKVVKALGTRGGSAEAMHLGKGGMYDHVEHSEEAMLNEDLLMLIDVLCEELGIDTEELLRESLSEARKMVSKKVRQNPEDKAALHAKLRARLDQLTSDHDNLYDEGGTLQWPKGTPEKDQTAKNLRSPSAAAKKALKAKEAEIKKHMRLMARHGL